MRVKINFQTHIRFERPLIASQTESHIALTTRTDVSSLMKRAKLCMKKISKVIDILALYVYIPTCCAPLTLGHKRKFCTASCGRNQKRKGAAKLMATKKGGKKGGAKGGAKKGGGKKGGAKKGGAKKR